MERGVIDGFVEKSCPFCGERMFPARDLGQHKMIVSNEYFGQHICTNNQ